MTVRELIELLETIPQDCIVKVYDSDYHCYREVTCAEYVGVVVLLLPYTLDDK